MLIRKLLGPSYFKPFLGWLYLASFISIISIIILAFFLDRLIISVPSPTLTVSTIPAVFKHREVGIIGLESLSNLAIHSTI